MVEDMIESRKGLLVCMLSSGPCLALQRRPGYPGASLAPAMFLQQCHTVSSFSQQIECTMVYSLLTYHPFLLWLPYQSSEIDLVLVWGCPSHCPCSRTSLTHNTKVSSSGPLMAHLQGPGTCSYSRQMR